MSQNVGAANIVNTGSIEPSSGRMYTPNSSYAFTKSNSSMTFSATGQTQQPGATSISSVYYCAASTIPARSLVLIDFYFNNGEYRPVLLSRSESSYSIVSNTSGEYGYSTSVLYFRNATSCFYMWPMSLTTSNNMRFDMSGLTYMTLDEEPSANLLQAIETNLANRLNTLHLDLNEVKELLKSLGAFDTGSMVEQQEQTNEKLDEINDTLKEQNEKEQQAEDNISNQKPDDMDGSENAATSSLIGIISSFIDALRNTEGSCTLTLPLPSNLGGSTSVNPCSGGTEFDSIIKIGSSVASIVFFLPLAFVMLRMIYNEIRSFTNANG